MYPIVLFDDTFWEDLLPLTFTRPSCELRLGMLTIKEKWEELGHSVFISTKDYLQKDALPDEVCIFLAGNLVPSKALKDYLSGVQIGDRGNDEGQALFFCGSSNDFKLWRRSPDQLGEALPSYLRIRRPADIFKFIQEGIDLDISLSNLSQNSAPKGVQCSGEDLYMAAGATIASGTIINTETGPVFLDEGAQIMEGCMIRGPLALGKGAVLKMGAKVYGPVAIGPHSKVGGEIGSSSIQGYSNKGHDGYLGNSVLGKWCNLGADTNTSNLKNNYSEVRTWNYRTRSMESSGETFHGLIMGDHSKCSINTMFNTGTVVGVAANIFGHGFPKKFVPSFTWGGNSEYRLDKALEVAERVMARRNIVLDDKAKAILKSIFEDTAEFRSF